MNNYQRSIVFIVATKDTGISKEQLRCLVSYMSRFLTLELKLDKRIFQISNACKTSDFTLCLYRIEIWKPVFIQSFEINVS